MRDSVDLVIFDCDGVLVDSERLAVDIDRQILAEFGLHLSPEEVIRRFMGQTEGLRDRTIEQHIGRGLTAEERGRMDLMFEQLCVTDLRAVDGIAEALSEITQAVCVASNSRPDGLRWKLELCGLLDRFDGNVFSASQVQNGKPAPDLFLFAAQTMGVEPASCIVVEDSPSGVRAARAAGMRAFAYLGGMVAPEVLEGPGTVLFDDMRALPELIAAEWPQAAAA
jgi:HAD superfamily hydrolase (TIGR01509 family)